MPSLQDPHSRLPAPTPPAGEAIDSLLQAALFEDRGPGDLTTEVAIAPHCMAHGELLAKDAGVLAGGGIFRRIFELVDPGVQCEQRVAEGASFQRGEVLFVLHGPARSLLIAERTALNFIQRLSGIASLTQQHVALCQGRAAILDTRKTTPGLRALEKYAVRCGGGQNHRFGLFDEVMVKDNHIDASGLTLQALLQQLRAAHGPEVRMTAEARDRDEALQALAGDADVILLDNMSPAEMRELSAELRAAESQVPKRTRAVLLEASGGIDLSNVAEISTTGVDRISIGALTHSVKALDLSLSLEILR